MLVDLLVREIEFSGNHLGLLEVVEEERVLLHLGIQSLNLLSTLSVVEASRLFNLAGSFIRNERQCLTI